MNKDNIFTAVSEQPQQDMDSASVINNASDLNGQASASQPIPHIDSPVGMTPEEKAMAIEVLKKAGFVDSEGRPCKKEYDPDAEVSMNAKVKIRTLKKAGFKLAYIDQNRQIHASNIKLLTKSLESLHETTFREAGKVIPAHQAIEEGLKVFTIDGEEVTLENADEYFVIIDGFHRAFCCEQYPWINMWLELAEYNGPTMTQVGILNNTRKCWDSKDIRHAIMAKYPGKVSALEEIHKLSKKFNVTEKCAELAITRKKDQFRRSELNAYQQGNEPADTSKYRCDEAKKVVAWDIMYSILIALKGRDKQLRKLKKIEFMAAIMDILTTLDKRGEKDGMKQFEQNISTFISLLTPDQIDDIVDLIDSKNFDDLNKMVNQAYFSFIKDNEADLDTLRQKNKKAIKAMKAELDASPITPEVKIGSPSELMMAHKAAVRKTATGVEKSETVTSSASNEEPAAIAGQQPESETTVNNTNKTSNNV